MWKVRSNGAAPMASAPMTKERGAARPTPAGEDQDAAVETISAMLRAYGSYAFDTDEADARSTNEKCEQWTRHLLYAAPRPAGRGELPAGRRDWLGVRHFVAQHRQGEYAYVTRAVGGMRQTIWAFIQELNRSLAGDHEAENQLSEQLERIRSATRRATIGEMRQEIAAAVTAISSAMEDRKRSQQKQIETLYAEIRQLGSQLEEARQESSLDSLTGLFNRRSFDQILSRTMAMGAVFDQKACLLLVDADHFKAVNDSYGHDAGDRVLKALADCFTRACPRKGDCIARYGGEEFAFIFADASLQDGRRMAERILAAVRDLRVDLDARQLSVTVSAGLASLHPEESADLWLKRADRALYRAKKLGRDRYDVV